MLAADFFHVDCAVTLQLPGYVRVFADEGTPMAALPTRLAAAQKADHATARGIPLGRLAQLLRAFGKPFPGSTAVPRGPPGGTAVRRADGEDSTRMYTSG